MLNKKINTFRNSIFWKQLLIKRDLINNIDIETFFINDPNRLKNFSIFDHNLNMFYDFSKQHLDASVLNDLILAAKHCSLPEKIQDLFNGKIINPTENKLALHTQLRASNPSMFIQTELNKIEIFINNLYKSEFCDILCLGIGGSYLGPMFVSNALTAYTHPLAQKIQLHFLANCDKSNIYLMLKKLNPHKTIIIISSKSFTTKETIHNANVVISWLKEQGNTKFLDQIFAITSKIDKAIEFGVLSKNIFSFSEGVGGRYSIWSAIGLPVIIKIGFDNFKKFLQGAYLVDQHFKNMDLFSNIPVIMGLISIWNINFMGYNSLGIIPYLDALNNFPEYLQQLSMESNGKSVDLENKQLDHDTVELIFGGIGCNVQHSFMQMLHQGTKIIPIDFLVSAIDNQLFANCIAQSHACMKGLHNIEPFKQCKGNRPSSILLFPKLTPTILGSIISLYEHKVFVQSIMWHINPFDQWGVELGKNLADQILIQMEDIAIKKQFNIKTKKHILKSHNNSQGSSINEMDDTMIPSISGLIDIYHKFNYE